MRAARTLEGLTVRSETLTAGPRDLIHNVTGRLFQAAMWRKHATEWDLPYSNIRRRWVEHVLRISKTECIRRARINLLLAKRLNKMSACIREIP